MNKTFFTKITAAAISLALLVTAFSACGKETPEYETDTAPETSQTAAAAPTNPLTGESDFKVEALGNRPTLSLRASSKAASPV